MQDHTTHDNSRFEPAENCKYALVFVRASELKRDNATDSEVREAIAAAEGNE